MNLFRKKSDAPASEIQQKKDLKNLFAHGGYALTTSIIAVVAVIILNIFMSALSSRVPVNIDLSMTGKNSISEENSEFIKTIEKPVTITVCATKDGYTGGELAYYAEGVKMVSDANSYYTQTVHLIDLYSKYNNNIKIEYVDMTSAAGATISTEFPDIFYGDIIVSHTDENNNTFKRVVTFDDIYSYYDDTGYGYSYTIDGNKIETALTSAINAVISGESKTGAILSSCSETSIFDYYFSSILKTNNINVTEISDDIISAIPDDIDQLYIVAPKKDLLPEELNIIGAWLNNSGNRGHSLIFIPGISMDNIPNLREFLSEWGISYSDGILYETDSSKYLPGDPTTMVVTSLDTDISKKITTSGAKSIIGNSFPMKTAYDKYSSKTAYTVVATSGTVTVAPSDMTEEWTPAKNAETDIYASLIITKDEEYIDNVLHTSYVAAFSSCEFIYSQWIQQSSLENIGLAVNTAVTAAGFNSDMIFIDKSIENESFAYDVTNSGMMIIIILFVVMIPLGLVVAGFVIWLRRKNR